MKPPIEYRPKLVQRLKIDTYKRPDVLPVGPINKAIMEKVMSELPLDPAAELERRKAQTRERVRKFRAKAK